MEYFFSKFPMLQWNSLSEYLLNIPVEFLFNIPNVSMEYFFKIILNIPLGYTLRIFQTFKWDIRTVYSARFDGIFVFKIPNISMEYSIRFIFFHYYYWTKEYKKFFLKMSLSISRSERRAIAFEKESLHRHLVVQTLGQYFA